jgi:HPt (histidine-containing phosphotransfer) domain-containing protein
VADSSIDELLALAKAQFASGLGARVAAIEGPVGRGAWQEARRAAHKLRGAAATYGFAALGASAGEIEDRLLEVRDAPGPELLPRIAELVATIRVEAARASAGSS